MRRRVQAAEAPAPVRRAGPPTPPSDAAAVAASIIPMPPRPQRAARGDRPPSKFQAALQAARRRAQSGEWATADGEAIVGLYAVCHEMVYGVLPSELEEGRLFKLASREAARLMRVSFGGDVDAAVEYLKWVWGREKGRVQWAASQSPPRERGRLGWRLSLSEGFVTDYRVALASRRRG